MTQAIRTWPLGRNLIIALMLILGVALLIERVYEYNVIYTRQLEEIMLTNVKEQGYILALDIEASLMTGKDQQVKQQITSRGVLSNLSLLALSDENGNILHATRLALSGRPLATSDPAFNPEFFKLATQSKQVQVMLSPDRLSVLGYAPVTLPSRSGELRSLRTGALFIHYDLTHIKAKRWQHQATWDTLLRWGLVLLAIVMLLQLLLKRMLFTPLGHLQQVALDLARGDLKSRASLNGTGELARLGEAYNQMAHEIRRNIRYLSVSESKFRTLVENFPGVVYRCAFDATWTVEYLSDGILALSGYPPSDFIGNHVRSYASIIHPDDVARVDQAVQESVKTKQPFVIEYRIIRADKEMRWVWERGVAQRDLSGEITHLDGAIFDITDRRLAEEQLRKLSLAVKQSPNSIVITDLAATIEYVNDTFSEVTGYSSNEAIGKNPRILQSGVTPPEIYLDMWETLSRGETWKGELVNRRKDGSLYNEYALISPVRQPDGHITHYLAIKSDITERKANEAELERYRHHLEDQVEARTAELAQARDAAESANRSKSVFLANMSHELRTPLNAILGFAQLMERDTRIPEAQRINLNTINKSGQHLLSLINDVLEISRIEAGRLSVSPAPCDLHELLATLTEVMTLRAHIKGLELTLESSPELPRYITTDIGKLRQILLNLLSNAVKYTEQGQVIIRAQRLALPSGEDVEKAGTFQLQFEIVDTGVGIEPENLEKIFQPFFQTEYGIRLGEGTGLGLTICREYAHLLGGDLSAVSTPGEGSVFRLILPVTGADELLDAGATGRVIGLAPGQASFRILVAEDDPDNQRLISELLSQAGLQVRIAQNGAEAVEMFRAWHPHFIWMDMRMPVMDGYAATRAIRALPGGDLLPIVALTASAFNEERENILAAGCSEMLTKPLDENRLFQMMALLLGIRFLHADAEASPESARHKVIDLSGLPAPLLAELKTAAALLDLESARFLIEGMTASHPEIARALAPLVNGFRFDELLALCQKAMAG